MFSCRDLVLKNNGQPHKITFWNYDKEYCDGQITDSQFDAFYVKINHNGKDAVKFVDKAFGQIVRDKSTILNRPRRLFDIKVGDEVYYRNGVIWSRGDVTGINGIRIKVWANIMHHTLDINNIDRIKSIELTL